jgi:ElaB/YqjD/DUF883 family membrane-anchored ribosome-binding protein
MSIPRKQTAKQAETLAGRAQELLDSTADVAGEKVEKARKHLTEALEQVQETAEETWDKVASRAKATDKLIRTNPYATIGIGIGIGVLIGLLLRGGGDSESE